MGKPNIIIICCDDLGSGDLGCYGSETAKTPNIDGLAHQGVRFTSWYSNSPVCSPSRAALLTGQYPARNGVRQVFGGKRGTDGLKATESGLASLFKNAGYDTSLCGKWHLGGTPDTGPNAHGFTEFFGFLAGCVDYYSHIFYWRQGQGVDPVHDLWHNGKEIWANGTYLTEWITEKSVQFIEAHETDPFFLYVPYNAPHFPMHAPQKYLDRFPDLPPDQQIMAAMVSAVDDGVGEIIDTLKRIGKYDDTVIFFTSDHGPSSQSCNHLNGTEDFYYGGNSGLFRGYKGSLFEGGLRVPAIMSYPSAIAGNRVCDEVGVMMDILPTFTSLAGISLPEQVSLDGENMLPVITSGAPSPHRQVFWEYVNQLAIREGRWKLVKNGMLDLSRSVSDPIYLSDLEADPEERVNLKDQFPDIAQRLEQELSAWAEAMKL